LYLDCLEPGIDQQDPVDCAQVDDEHNLHVVTHELRSSELQLETPLVQHGLEYVLAVPELSVLEDVVAVVFVKDCFDVVNELHSGLVVHDDTFFVYFFDQLLHLFRDTVLFGV
jgi:hypothetical protein